METETPLQISGLTKTYGDGIRALDGVTLKISRGLFGLLGPNGAGKSTLMRTIATLQEPDAGTIELNGHDVLRDPSYLRSRLGYLPQEFGVYPGLSAIRLLDHLAVLKGIDDAVERRAQIERLLNLTNLWKVRRRAVSSFSGGMKQRFGIAQALLGKPEIVIVDEPTAGLDPEERNRFNNLLSEIGEEVVVILSTHIVDDVSELCSRMAIISAGRVRLEGIPSELTAALRGKIWWRTVEKGSVAGYRASYRVLSTHLFSGQTRIHVLADQLPEAGFQSIEPTLEDVYFSVLNAVPDAEAAA